MSRHIVKLDDWYFEWSTVADGPTTKGLSLPNLAAYIAEEYGIDGLVDLGDRLRRVEASGTSSLDGTTADEMIVANRAGPRERCLTKAEIIRQYVPHLHTPNESDPPKETNG